ncbi:MAG: MarR family winged helix-turn-helix transcriptional regulator [Rhodospirillaceae bacterium]|nr:MarR family winged helix-turn-helix transcriptional regulator [Rhodospirillaceae bacterium]
MTTKSADFDLTVYLPFLVNRTGVRLASAFSQAIRHHGISLQMWRVLAALHHQDDLRISDLSSLTSIDISTLSRLVGNLEKLDLVARRRNNDEDARVVTVERTAKGRAMTEVIIPVAQHYEVVALAGFSRQEARTLKMMLARVHANLDQTQLNANDSGAAT